MVFVSLTDDITPTGDETFIIQTPSSRSESHDKCKIVWCLKQVNFDRVNLYARTAEEECFLSKSGFQSGHWFSQAAVHRPRLEL